MTTMKSATAATAKTNGPDQPHQPHREALRTLALGLCRWATGGLGGRNGDASDDHPIIAALDRTDTALYLPHDDVAASETACLAAFKGLVDAFVVLWAETDLLNRHEGAVLWHAVGYLDALDVTLDVTQDAVDEEAERQEPREQRERLCREDMARTCFAEAQRERTRGQRNRQRQRREENPAHRTAVAA